MNGALSLTQEPPVTIATRSAWGLAASSVHLPIAGLAFEIVGRSGPFLTGAAIMLAALFLARRLQARKAVNTIP